MICVGDLHSIWEYVSQYTSNGVHCTGVQLHGMLDIFNNLIVESKSNVQFLMNSIVFGSFYSKIQTNTTSVRYIGSLSTQNGMINRLCSTSYVSEDGPKELAENIEVNKVGLRFLKYSRIRFFKDHSEHPKFKILNIDFLVVLIYK